MKHKVTTDMRVASASQGPDGSARDGSGVAVPITPPSWLPRALGQLEAMRSVGPNWDGYDADAPRAAPIDGAIEFVRQIPSTASLPAPFISPTRTGGVVVEWEHGCHELEVEFESPAATEFLYLNTSTQESMTGTLPDGPSEDFLEIARRLAAK